MFEPRYKQPGGCLCPTPIAQLPASRREEAFRMNDGGWTGQVENITEYLAAP